MQSLLVFVWDDDVQERKLKCRGCAKIRIRLPQSIAADCLDVAVWPDGSYRVTTGKESTFSVGETLCEGILKVSNGRT